eukprot:c14742_g1_i1.p1 GENE.c14742_g1_i1~~c14742_g1_i1.p1  ORF type:complete len:169 (+),score=31.20 c14742_g1_i1:40-546(+)
MFPPPPVFYRLYGSYNKDGQTDTFENIDGYYLAPPVPPSETKIKVFGDDVEYNLKSTSILDLQVQSLTYLYDPENPDQAQELQRMNAELAQEFKNFVRTSSSGNTDAARAHFTRIEQLFINMQHLLAVYRPRQARHTLVSMMQASHDQSQTMHIEAQRHGSNHSPDYD